MRDGKKTVAEMMGEFLREAAVLVAVFIPLDMIFTGHPLPRPLFALGMCTFLLCLVCGIILERMRP